jgi:hypothetical protein
VNPLTRRQRIEELDALLDGRLAPEHATASVRRLASVATTVVDHDPFPGATLGDDRKAALRDRLLADITASPTPVAERTREALAPRVRRAANRTRVAVASTMAAAMIGTTGVAVAAQEALPGDTLYGVKKATESLRLSLAGDQVATGRLELLFAERRLEEIIEGSQDRRVASDDALIGALDEMDERSLSGAEQLIGVAEDDARPELIEEVAAFADRQAAALVAAYPDLPAAVRPHAEDSLGVLRRIQVELLVPAIERCDCVDPAGSGSPPEPAEPRELAWFRSAAAPPSSADGPAREAVVPTLRSVADADASATAGQADAAATGGTGGTTGATSTVGEAVEDTTSAVEDTTSAVERTGTTSGVTGTVEDTANPVERTVEDTTSSATDAARDTAGSAVDDTVDDAAGAVGGAVDGATSGGTVGGAVDDATSSVGDGVGGATDPADDAVGSVRDLLP